MGWKAHGPDILRGAFIGFWASKEENNGAEGLIIYQVQECFIILPGFRLSDQLIKGMLASFRYPQRYPPCWRGSRCEHADSVVAARAGNVAPARGACGSATGPRPFEPADSSGGGPGVRHAAAGAGQRGLGPGEARPPPARPALRRGRCVGAPAHRCNSLKARMLGARLIHLDRLLPSGWIDGSDLAMRSMR